MSEEGRRQYAADKARAAAEKAAGTGYWATRGGGGGTAKAEYFYNPKTGKYTYQVGGGTPGGGGWINLGSTQPAGYVGGQARGVATDVDKALEKLQGSRIQELQQSGKYYYDPVTKVATTRPVEGQTGMTKGEVLNVIKHLPKETKAEYKQAWQEYATAKESAAGQQRHELDLLGGDMPLQEAMSRSAPSSFLIPQREPGWQESRVPPNATQPSMAAALMQQRIASGRVGLSKQPEFKPKTRDITVDLTPDVSKIKQYAGQKITNWDNYFETERALAESNLLLFKNRMQGQTKSMEDLSNIKLYEDVSGKTGAFLQWQSAQPIIYATGYAVGIGYVAKAIPAVAASKLPGINLLAKMAGTKGVSTALRYGWGASLAYRGYKQKEFFNVGEWERGLVGLGKLGGEYLGVKIGTSGRLKLPEIRKQQFFDYKGFTYKYGSFEQSLIGVSKGRIGRIVPKGGTPIVDISGVTSPITGEQMGGAGTKALLKTFKVRGLMSVADINKFTTIYGMTRAVEATPSPYTTDMFIPKTRTLNVPEVTKVLEFAEAEGMEVAGSLAAYQHTGLMRTSSPEGQSLEQFKQAMNNNLKDFGNIVKDVGVKKEWSPESEILKTAKAEAIKHKAILTGSSALNLYVKNPLETFDADFKAALPKEFITETYGGIPEQLKKGYKIDSILGKEKTAGKEGKPFELWSIKDIKAGKNIVEASKGMIGDYKTTQSGLRVQTIESAYLDKLEAMMNPLKKARWQKDFEKIKIMNIEGFLEGKKILSRGKLPADMDIIASGMTKAQLVFKMPRIETTLKGLGYSKFELKPGRSLVEKFIPEKGQFVHAVDAHAMENIQDMADISKDAEKLISKMAIGDELYGLPVNQEPIKIPYLKTSGEMGQIDTMPLSEQAIRKMNSILTMRPPSTKGKLWTLSPEAHRMKDYGGWADARESLTKIEPIGVKQMFPAGTFDIPSGQTTIGEYKLPFTIRKAKTLLYPLNILGLISGGTYKQTKGMQDYKMDYSKLSKASPVSKMINYPSSSGAYKMSGVKYPSYPKFPKLSYPYSPPSKTPSYPPYTPPYKSPLSALPYKYPPYTPPSKVPPYTPPYKYPSSKPPRKLPPLPPPPKVPPFWFSFKGKGSGKKKERKVKPWGVKYSPSLVAGLERISMPKMPTRITGGLGIRPVVLKGIKLRKRRKRR